MLPPFDNIAKEDKCNASDGGILGFWPASDIKAIIPLPDGTVSVKFKRKGTYRGKYYSREMVKLESE